MSRPVGLKLEGCQANMNSITLLITRESSKQSQFILYRFDGKTIPVLWSKQDIFHLKSEFHCDKDIYKNRSNSIG